MKGPVINGKKYKLVVLRPCEWDSQGRPSKVEIGYDDTVFRLDDATKSNEFITAFVGEFAAKPQTKN